MGGTTSAQKVLESLRDHARIIRLLDEQCTASLTPPKFDEVNGIVTTLTRIEHTYDALPRAGGAEVEQVGPFELFLPGRAPWPFYARPRLDCTRFDLDDVSAVRARQRELGLPQAIEWVNDVTPGLLDAVRASDMPVVLAPLMLWTPSGQDPDPGVDLDAGPVRLEALDPDAAEFAHLYASSGVVAHLGFGSRTTAIGSAGVVERNAALARTPPDPARLAWSGARIRAGLAGEVVARTDADGVLARGGFQGARVADDWAAAEVAGVATLPAFRRRGLGAAVSAALVRLARRHGYTMVFLSAADDDAARIYARIGFTRIGTACIAEA
jgi:GNAT superfamily N-acetyltransferase